MNNEIIDKFEDMNKEESIIPNEIKIPKVNKSKNKNFGKTSIYFNKDLSNLQCLEKEYLEQNDLLCSELQYYDENKTYYIIQKRNFNSSNNKDYILDFYLCNLCYKKCDNKHALTMHFNRESDCTKYIKLQQQDDNNPKIHIQDINNNKYEYYCKLEDEIIKYFCNKCNHKFNTKSNMIEHFNSIRDCITFSNTKENPITFLYYEDNEDYKYYKYYDKEKNKWILVCNYCKKESQYRTFLREHFNKTIRCYEYNKDFIYKYNNKEFKFYKQLNEKNNIEEYICSNCKYNVLSISGIYKHFRREVTCDEFNKLILYQNNENYKYYVDIQDNIIKNICNNCKYTTPNLSNIYRHLLICN